VIDTKGGNAGVLPARRRIARVLAAAALLAGAALAFGCTEDRIVLAHIAAESDDGGGSSSGTPALRCASIADCKSGFYCDKAACRDPAGTCTRMPVDCEGDHSPVCGCDGIIYYNDCLRRQRAIESKEDGECPPDGTIAPVFCSSNTPCDGGAYCAEIFGGGGGPGPDCPPDVHGTCWVLPQQCEPTPQGPSRFNVCGPAGALCVDSCHAIASGQPFRPAHPSDCPPPPPP
jgi:hypothetical protein